MDICKFILGNQSYFEDFVTRSTYHSNRIEGNTLSYAETYAILFNDNRMKIKTTPRELYEAINHKYALSYVLDIVSQAKTPQTAPALQELLKHINHLITKNIDESDGYRQHQVLIQGAEHIPPTPQQVPMQMTYFADNYLHSAMEPYERAAAFHIQLERIHPFSDGNGRTGRLLVNYELLRCQVPPVVISADDRAEYMEMLATQNVPSLAAFFRQTSEQEQLRMAAFQEASVRNMS